MQGTAFGCFRAGKIGVVEIVDVEFENRKVTAGVKKTQGALFLSFFFSLSLPPFFYSLFGSDFGAPSSFVFIFFSLVRDYRASGKEKEEVI